MAREGRVGGQIGEQRGRVWLNPPYEQLVEARQRGLAGFDVATIICVLRTSPHQRARQT